MNRFIHSVLLVTLLAITPHCLAQEDYKTYFSRGNEYFKNDKFDDAIEWYTKSIACTPTCQAYFNLGLTYAGKMDNVNAEKNYRHALELNPHYAKAHFMLGGLLKETDRPQEALIYLDKALELEPNNFDALLYSAHLYTDLRDYTKATILFIKALQLQPHNTQCQLDYANTLNMMNRTEEALNLYCELYKELPRSPSIIYNIAYTLKKLGRIQEALDYYYRVLELDPNHAECHFGLGVAYLSIEDFERGWKEYEWRWNRSTLTPRTFEQPRWDGSDIAGKTILLYAEQGLGDTLQFIRYAKLLKDKGATVYFATQNQLVDLLSLCPYLDKVVPLYGSVPHFDTHAPLMSVPFIMGTRVETIPHEIPYLYARTDLVEEWAQKLSLDHSSFKIGICWQGNPNYSTPFLRNTVAAKSMKVTEFEPIAKIHGVSLYSLQKTSGEEQLKNLPEGFIVHDFGPDFDIMHGRFMDTAAVMKNLDLVITVDTSVVHLAGGLGVPTWMLLPEPADWRWMMRQSDTPWYPHLRMFRQPRPDDWKSVIERVAQELKKMIANRVH
jgi:Tfp pilus assembly protein PilF